MHAVQSACDEPPKPNYHSPRGHAPQGYSHASKHKTEPKLRTRGHHVFSVVSLGVGFSCSWTYPEHGSHTGVLDGSSFKLNKVASPSSISSSSSSCRLRDLPLSDKPCGLERRPHAVVCYGQKCVPAWQPCRDAVWYCYVQGSCGQACREVVPVEVDRASDRGLR